MRQRQSGFTMVELIVTLSVIAIMLSFLVPNIWRPITDAKIRGAVSQAKQLVSTCDLVRVTPVSTSRDATNLKVTKNYGPEYSSWTDVSVLKAKLSSDYTMPTENPFGRPYLFKMSERSCVVAVDLDELIEGREGYDLETVGTRTRIVVGTPARSMAGPGWVQQQNRFLTGETIR